MSQTCPFCETGTTEVVSYTSTEKFGRKSVNVEGLLKLVCNHCHSETVSGDLHDHNLALFIAAEEGTQGGVSPGLLRTLRENWDLTQSEASKLFGAGPSSFAKWESSQTKLSTPAALLIQVASRFPEVVPYLAQLAKVQLNINSVKSKIEIDNKQLGTIKTKGERGSHNDAGFEQQKKVPQYDGF
jgi:putative zinc finger/helix-turn-helix YgiT family protein